MARKRFTGWLVNVSRMGGLKRWLETVLRTREFGTVLRM